MHEKKLKWPRTFPELDKLNFPDGSADSALFLAAFIDQRLDGVVTDLATKHRLWDAAARIASFFWVKIMRWASHRCLVHVISGLHKRGRVTVSGTSALDRSDAYLRLLLQSGILVIRTLKGQHEVGFAHPEIFLHVLADLHLGWIRSGEFERLQGRYPYLRQMGHLHSALLAQPASVIKELASSIKRGLEMPLGSFAKSLLFAIWAYDCQCGSGLIGRPASLDLTGLMLYHLRVGGKPEKPLDMRGTNLSGSRFVSCIISHVNLDRMSLRHARLDYCWLSDATLDEADLSDSHLVCCFRKVTGHRVNLDDALLETYGPCAEVEIGFIGKPDQLRWRPCAGIVADEGPA